jgi:hypothetical protein
MLAFDLGCMTCAAPVELVTAGNGWRREQRAVVRCTACRRRWVVVAVILPADPIDPAPPSTTPLDRHGTIYGWRHGCSCSECTEANRTYERERKRRQRQRYPQADSPTVEPTTSVPGTADTARGLASTTGGR